MTVASLNGKASAEPASSSVAVEVIYRGVFQKLLANRISRGVVLGARKTGKVGTAFGRYGDSPERNGIPAKSFAVVAPDEEELEHSLARFEPDAANVTIALDDTLCKGLESWAWYGVQAVNALLVPGGTLVVTSDRSADHLLKAIKAKPFSYNLVVVPSESGQGPFAPEGTASLSGLFAYRDDNTDYYCMAAVAKAAPSILSIDAVLDIVREQTKSDERAAQVKAVYEALTARVVKAGEGSTVEYEEYTKPGWTKMRPAVIVDAPAVYSRNPVFKKWSTRTRRPLVNFETCIKCTQCWLQCPDEAFEVMPDGTYEVVYEACIGCGVCAEVCPVKDCITMHPELEFANNNSLYHAYASNPARYRALLEEHDVKLHPELVEKASNTPAVHKVPTIAGGEE